MDEYEYQVMKEEMREDDERRWMKKRIKQIEWERKHKK